MLPEKRRSNFFSLLNQMEKEFNEVFDFIRPETIKADIEETDTHYIITADIPGVPKENIEVDYTNDVFTISGKVSSEKEEKEGNFIRKERHVGAFSRSWLVRDINEDTISAELKDGVLTVKLEKSVEKQRKKIDIEIK